MPLGEGILPFVPQGSQCRMCPVLGFLEPARAWCPQMSLFVMLVLY